jgi:hypothetical protein
MREQVTRERKAVRENGPRFPRQRTANTESKAKHRPGFPHHVPSSTN